MLGLAMPGAPAACCCAQAEIPTPRLASRTMPGTRWLRMYRSFVCQSPRCFDANPRQPGRAAGAARLLGPAPKVHNGGMFDWNDLKYFLAVAVHGSTIAGGKALGTSQTTQHRQLTNSGRRF